MGLAGVLLLSSAGGLSIVLSTVLIRRKLRRRQAMRREVSTEFFPASTNECSDTTMSQNIAFIKTRTSQILSKLSVVFQPSPASSGVSVWLNNNAAKPSPVLNDSEAYKDDPVTKIIPADEESNCCQGETFADSRLIIQRGSGPLKEFTTQTSHVACNSDISEDGIESPELSETLDYDRASEDSGSQKLSCSFADDCFTSEKESPAKDESFTGTKLEKPKFTKLIVRHGKRVSFQFEDQLCQFPHGAWGGEKRGADINTKTVIKVTNDRTSALDNDDTVATTGAGAAARMLSSTIADPDSQHVKRIPVIHDAVTGTQEASDSPERMELTEPRERSEDQHLHKAKKCSFVSIEPLTRISALDNVGMAWSTSATPILICEQNYRTSLMCDVTSTRSIRRQERIEGEHAQSLSMPKEYSQNTYGSSDDEEENYTCSPASSPERLCRQPQRGTERTRVVRGNTHPARKRFRFSNRMKVRPLRPSGGNSN